MQRKLAFAFLAITLALFALSIVLAKINSEKGTAYAQTVLSQYSSGSSTTVIAARGEICDRNGSPLALNEKVYNLIIDAHEILTNEDFDYLDETVSALHEAFGYEEAELRALIQEKAESRYIRYARQLSEAQKEAFDEIQERVNTANAAEKDEKGKKSNKKRVGGIWFETEYKRIYPYKDLACELLGFASSDGSAGNWGLEQYYNDLLVGKNGSSFTYIGSDGFTHRELVEAENGKTLITTIDPYIQGVVQKHIKEFNDAYGSRNTGVVVMDPDSGEILAMASDDRFDLNDPYSLSLMYTEDQIAQMTDEQVTAARLDMWRNYCISDTYEPGSTAKAFTITAAMDEGIVTPSSYFTCDGGQWIGPSNTGRYIRCWYHAGHGEESLKQTFINSCNDAMMQIVAKMGVEKFVNYQKIFGLGRKTGVDLPGEADAASLIYHLDNMRVTDLATNSFGQNFNVTMIQMASAYCSIVNGGKYYEPHLLKRVLDSDGTVLQSNDALLVRETISEDSSRFLRQAMLGVVEEGTSRNSARVEGYSVGGKTGTAEKYPRGNGKYVVSFISAVPAENPEVIVYVVIDEPQTDRPNSNSWACLLNRSILKEILPYLNVYTTSGEAPTPDDPFGTGTEPVVDPEDPTGEMGDTFTQDDNDMQPAGYDQNAADEVDPGVAEGVPARGDAAPTAQPAQEEPAADDGGNAGDAQDAENGAENAENGDGAAQNAPDGENAGGQTD